MTTPRYARIASKILEDSVRDDAYEPPSMEARACAIHAIERAIVVRAERRRRSRWVAASMAAAAVVLLGVGATAAVRELRAPSTPTASAAIGVASPLIAMSPVLRGSANVVLIGAGASDTQAIDGAPIAHGQRLVARASGHATLAFATGTELTIEERGDLTIDDSGASQRFTLGAGAVSARVAKLSAGNTLVITTPDAEVEVHGTTFRVAVVPADAACGNGTTTRVDVLEGVVAVNAKGASSSVRAGEHWPSGCPSTVAPPASAIAAVEPKKSVAPIASSPSAVAASQLAEQNDLFAEAVAAKRRGANGQAIATFDRFLAKYPSSPLAESATAERMRLLRSGDRSRAQTAARDYLARFPNGFARADAQAILADTP